MATSPSKLSVRVLAQRNFAPFFIGNFLSNTGTWFQVLAQSLLMYRLTGSTFMVGLVNFAQFFGVLVLSPWSGPAADRFDRKRLLIVTQLGLSLVTAFLAVAVLIGKGTVLLLMVQTFVYGFIAAFATPAMGAIVPGLVSREDLGAATAMNSVTFNLARAAGPPVAALVIGTLGIGWAIACDAVSYLLLVGGLLLVHPRTAKPERKHGQKLRLIDSVRMMRERRELLVVLVAVAAVSISMDPVTTLTPAFATKIFHHKDTMTGLLIGAFGGGAVLAALAPYGHESIRRLIAPMLTLMGAAMIAFAFMPVPAGAFICLAIAGFGYLAGQTRATTLLQLSVEDHERGRVMALWSIAFLGSRPIASLADGALASVLGPRATVIVFAVPVLAAAALTFALPRLRARESAYAREDP